MKRKYSPARLAIALVETVLIAWAIVFLAEYFGWHLVREAGGSVASQSSYTRAAG
jgi:hypothetical protein